MKPLIIANWKCNPDSLNQAKRILDPIKRSVAKKKNAEVVICPPFIYLPELIKSAGKTKIKIGGENCFWEEAGSFTGEISAKMLKDLGCSHVIIGHSERRKYFKETNKLINKKIKLALRNNLKVIFCIGETKEEKDKGDFSKVIKEQVKKGLKNVPRSEMKKVIIAYEPVWAIGSGNPCRPVQAQVTSLLVKKILTEMYNRKAAEEVPVLYGGSANKDNSLDYLKEEGIKGLLIGGASLKPKEFIEIINDANNL
jgi:triosephosphate isomerase (TIM)